MDSLRAVLADFDHPWLRALAVPWPVAIGARHFDPLTVQQELACTRADVVGDGRWRVDLVHPPTGLRIEWHLRWFSCADTLELSGRVVNAGDEPIFEVGPPRALAWIWDLPDFGEGWARTVTGGPWIDVTFPPHGLTACDHQFVAHRQFWRPFEMDADDGRPTRKHLPVVALADERQRHGVVAALEWCGNWRLQVEPHAAHPFRRGDVPFHRGIPARYLSLAAGYEPTRLTLAPGAELPLPRAILTFFRGDLSAGSNQFRRHLRDHVTPSLDGEPVAPPVSYNHWIGYAIHEFDAAAALAEAAICGDLGVEYFCFDAGWYAGGFRAGNGNWDRPDQAKIPDGLPALAEAIEAHDMKFGLWAEPEFAHVDSDLARQHPDWLRSRGEGDMRMLDFGLAEVRQWWVDWFARAADAWRMRWLRWDMNEAPQTYWAHEEPADEVGLRQIRHVQGLYETLEGCLSARPEVLIEGCAGGGQRFEPGLLRRCHTYWINDQSTSPHFVRHYLHGANIFYPGNYANAALAPGHVELTESDWLSHFAGAFAISERLTEWPLETRRTLARHLARYKTLRPLLLEDVDSLGGQPRVRDGWYTISFGSPQRGVRMIHRLHSEDDDRRYRDRPFRLPKGLDALIETWGDAG